MGVLISGMLVLVLLAAGGCSRLARGSGAAGPLPLAASAPSGRLQEVAPPLGVQQLQRRLDGRRPQLSIAAPEDGSMLPAGSWTLRINGADWPLTDPGPLGLGAHLALQVDDGLPRRLTAAASKGETFALAVPMAELSPGSHRVTVMAMRPWGEVVKRPGASAQIRLHRIAANPLALPAPGTPQLIVTSPAEALAAEPVLLDWLLQDAPLQGLREGDDRWRLRVTINGDSFLVDQNTPLWLKGWRKGSNSLLMELVDERGEPINPPFNSLVREVTLATSSPRPRWLDGALSERELGVLLGEAPATGSLESEGLTAGGPAASSGLQTPGGEGADGGAAGSERGQRDDASLPVPAADTPGPDAPVDAVRPPQAESSPPSDQAGSAAAQQAPAATAPTAAVAAPIAAGEPVPAAPGHKASAPPEDPAEAAQ
ncbi:MAG: hypothetical protein AAFX65_02380 [Cyanobacteria bacterium J06638_7]